MVAGAAQGDRGLPGRDAQRTGSPMALARVKARSAAGAGDLVVAGLDAQFADRA